MSPDLLKFPGDIQTRRDDGLSVSFRIDSDTVVTESIFINYHAGNAFFDKQSYVFGDMATITVEDRDMNRNPDTVDTVSVRIWSDSDRGGLFVILRETGASTGVFQEVITFTNDDASSGNRLKVSEGDTLVLKYTDSTLPPPAKLDADGIETVEVKEVFAFSLFGYKGVGTVSFSEPVLLNSSGQEISKIIAGEHLIIRSEITNESNIDQSFVYVVKIVDEYGVTVSLSWVTSELTRNSSFTATQSWLPSASGYYVIETFVWEDLQSVTALSPAKSVPIQVK
ncbi:MAG: hypothetical protein QXW73_02155 [Nitrososphaerales archaeon]